MADANGVNSGKAGAFILRFRVPIGAVLVIVTLFLAYWAAHVPIATHFEDFFPANHPNTLLYRKYRRKYGGAQTLVLMLRLKHGDIFNFKTLQTIQDMNTEVNALPGVNHNEVFSLASYRVAYARALPGELASSPFMYPKVPQTEQQLKDLKQTVLAHHGQLAGYVTPDDKGALVIASFNEEGLDYGALFNDVQNIIKKHQDANTRIYASGPAMFSAWGYHYLPRIALIFLVSIVLMLLILFFTLGRRTGWWAPILTGICSAIWGLGFMSLMRFNFDPVMLVIPFILTACDLSHGIQWHGRYYEELDRVGDKMAACASTANRMMAPGVLAVLANVAGIVFLACGDIPALRQIGFGGAVWLGASVAMVFVFQPILMSYLARPEVREHSWFWRTRDPNRKSSYRSAGEWLTALPLGPGALRIGLIAGGVVLLIAGVVESQRTLIGYQTEGTPIYRPAAKINRDTAEISKFIPTNYAWVVLETPNYMQPHSSIAIGTLRMMDDLSSYLMSRGDAVAVISFANVGTKPMNQLLHNGSPKYMAMPNSNALSGALWGFFFSGTAPDEVYQFFANSPNMTSTCIRVLLPDHTYTRLRRLRTDVAYFVKHRVKPAPDLTNVKVLYLGGDAGLYLAADDVISHLNTLNIALALAAIFLCCAVVFRSITAGILFAIASVMANFAAFIYMDAYGIGLTIDTIPVITIGIGVGIDFGIYTVARIREEVASGKPLESAIATALRTTGGWVFATFLVIVAGMIPWVFSPLLFHNEMSILLILLMVANVLIGLWVLPAFIAWRRPRFVTSMAPPASEHAEPVAGAHVG